MDSHPAKVGRTGFSYRSRIPSAVDLLPFLLARYNSGKKGEDQIDTEPASAPYGYPSDCPTSSRKFKAAPGSRLTVAVVKTGAGPLPQGELIVVGSWLNTKDKLVGIALDEDLRKVSKIAVISGSVLILLASWLIWRRPA